MHRAPTRSKAKSLGFTLLELLVVLLIMALGSAGVAWSLRQTPEQTLEREAQRLIYWLEVARVQASVQGQRVQWVATPLGYSFWANGPSTLPKELIPWLASSTRVISSNSFLVLVPEPILSPQSIELGMQDTNAVRIKISTNGLSPFALSR
jgi:general secretion pathway protein H